MDDRHHEVFAVATLFLLLTWLTVGLRCYVRGKMTKTWGHDDYYMVASLVSQLKHQTVQSPNILLQLVFTVYLAFQITAAAYGTGRHRWNLSDKDARTALLVSSLSSYVKH